MSALDINNTPQNAASVKARILVMGQASQGIASALIRMQSNAEIIYAETINEAVETLRTGNFDHVLVDNREDGTMALAIPTLARLENVAKITVLAGSKSHETISAVPGISSVILHPYNPVEIAGSLGIEIKDSRKLENDGQNQGQRAQDNAVVAGMPRPENPIVEEDETVVAEEEQEREASRPHLIRAIISIANFIPGFTPVISVIYKNLALTILAALFLAFVMYGIMIGFFLVSGDWSSPIQLQRGHELVIKAERERGELQVKRNLITQQLADAQNKADRGRKTLNRADTLAQIANVTLEQEISNREARYELLLREIKTLQELVASYGSDTGRKTQLNALHKDFKNRLVTRHIYQQSRLNLAEIEKTIISLRQQISDKMTEATLGQQAIAYLTQLKSQLNRTEGETLITSGNAEFVPIANQIIEVNQIRTSGKADINEYKATSKTLKHSQRVLAKSIQELEATPMIRALDAPINALFVPYDNLNEFQTGERLYTCAVAVFWCSEVGTVGKPIDGEIVTTHPFFGKPIRGQFVEANLTEKSAAQKEIIHVGRPPFFF